MSGAAPVPLQLAIVTGLSGAGRSTVAKCLEDLGWFVVDNLPPALLSRMAELAGRSDGAVSRVAAVVDARGRGFFRDLSAALDALDKQSVHSRTVFLEASDSALVRRFESVRRPHPLQRGERLIDGITRERAMLTDLRERADLVLDTSDLNVHQLRAQIEGMFGLPADGRLSVTLVSFGFKYGLPVDADLMVDCRFLPNPHWVEGLRDHTGLDADVRDHVLGQPSTAPFLERYTALLESLAPDYEREGKRYLTLAVGCTGGKHRSVAVAVELAARLNRGGLSARVTHRDLGRE